VPHLTSAATPACPALPPPQVDATQFAGGSSVPAACAGNQLLLHQIDISDVLVGSKADVCDTSALAAFQLWAGQLFPPKQLVATARHGVVEGPAAAQLADLLAWPAAASACAQGGSNGSGGGSSQSVPGLHQQEHLRPQQLAAQERPQRSAAGIPWLSSSTAHSGSLAGGSGTSQPVAEATPWGRRPERKQVQDASGAHAACG
jgi:G3E family GTPase